MTPRSFVSAVEVKFQKSAIPPCVNPLKKKTLLQMKWMLVVFCVSVFQVSANTEKTSIEVNIPASYKFENACKGAFVESITILKDEETYSKFGVNNRNGVKLTTTIKIIFGQNFSSGFKRSFAKDKVSQFCCSDKSLSDKFKLEEIPFKPKDFTLRR